MNHGIQTWATVPRGQHGDTATIDGRAMRCVVRGMHTMWLPEDLAHHTHIT